MFFTMQMHLIKVKSVLQILRINSFGNEDSERTGNTATHTYNDVNKFYLPTFSKYLKLSASWGITEPGTLLSVD